MGRVFVLEDDTDIREIVVMMLESEHYNVASFATVHDFVNRDVSEVPDLIILDVMLPDGSGLDICDQITEKCGSAKPPIIIMSAHANLSDVTHACSAESFIQKPFDINFFLDRVRTHITKSAK